VVSGATGNAVSSFDDNISVEPSGVLTFAGGPGGTRAIVKTHGESDLRSSTVNPIIGR
jgi:hypothetical protein